MLKVLSGLGEGNAIFFYIFVMVVVWNLNVE